MSLVISRSDACWTLTIDRPEAANSLSDVLVEQLYDAVEAAGAAGVHVLVLRGAGRNFSAGFDLAALDRQTDADLLYRFVRIELLLQALDRSPCLTIGFAHGANFGAGVDLLAACRWRFADNSATFRMPGLAFGIVLGTRRFASLVGRECALDVLENLRSFGAEEARRIGFIRGVCPQQGWAEVVLEGMATVTRMPPANRAALSRSLAHNLGDASLADLVRSAAQPDLKQRMLAYQAIQKSARSDFRN